MKKITFVFLASLLASSVSAGVAEKKARQAAEEGIATAQASMKSACGNANVEVVIAWDQVDAMITKNSALIAEKKFKI